MDIQSVLIVLGLIAFVAFVIILGNIDTSGQKDEIDTLDQPEQKKEKSLLTNISLLNGEHIVTDVQQGILQRAFDITQRNNIVLTNKRVIIYFNNRLTSSNQYILSLDDISLVTVNKYSSLMGSIIIFFIFTILTLVTFLQFQHSREVEVITTAIGGIGVLLSLLHLALGSRTYIEFAIPGFYGRAVTNASLLPLLLLLILPPLGLILLLARKLSAPNNGLLSFSLSRSTNVKKLAIFVEKLFEEKEKRT
jgi:hypothetical protein